jgi:nucleoid-associated protein YgaU
MTRKPAKNKSTLIGSLLGGGLVIYGCASLTGDDGGPENQPFQASNNVESPSAAAEISTDLLEVPEIEDPKAAKLKAKDPTLSPTPLMSEIPARKPASATEGGPDEVLPPGTKTVKHTVRKGDTLMKLSFKYFGNVYRWRQIHAVNRSKISDFNNLVAGTELVIPAAGPAKIARNGRPYGIKRGDTLSKISRWLYGTISSWKILWKNNTQLIRNPHKIYAGFTLYYPGKSVHDAPPSLRGPASTSSAAGAVVTPEPTPLPGPYQPPGA